jgi:hypothetical protein
VVDVALGRVFRAGQEQPAVLSFEVATAYGFGVGDFAYAVEPVDDQRMPAAGVLLTAMTGAPTPWVGWDPNKSYTMLGALRASDLHRIGRVWAGLPQVALITLTIGPLTVHQDLACAAGATAAATERHHLITSVALA